MRKWDASEKGDGEKGMQGDETFAEQAQKPYTSLCDDFLSASLHQGN